MKQRKVKISSVFRKRKWRVGSLFPYIRLQGAWIEKAGFEIGDNLEIEVAEGMLILMKCNKSVIK